MQQKTFDQGLLSVALTRNEYIKTAFANLSIANIQRIRKRRLSYDLKGAITLYYSYLRPQQVQARVDYIAAQLGGITGTVQAQTNGGVKITFSWNYSLWQRIQNFWRNFRAKPKPAYT